MNGGSHLPIPRAVRIVCRFPSATASICCCRPSFTLIPSSPPPPFLPFRRRSSSCVDDRVTLSAVLDIALSTTTPLLGLVCPSLVPIDFAAIRHRHSGGVLRIHAYDDPAKISGCETSTTATPVNTSAAARRTRLYEIQVEKRSARDPTRRENGSVSS